MSIRIKAAAEAMRAKRSELQHLPLDRIYEALAEAAIVGFHNSMKDRIREIVDEIKPTGAFSNGERE